LMLLMLLWGAFILFQQHKQTNEIDGAVS
jgi:hypothetical protein